jgi:hypothetical protein
MSSTSWRTLAVVGGGAGGVNGVGPTGVAVAVTQLLRLWTLECCLAARLHKGTAGETSSLQG